METVVLFLLLLVCFNFLLKQTFSGRCGVLATALVCGLFVGLAWPWAVEQSKEQIRAWLADPALMLDTSVVLSVEAVLQLSFCLLAVRCRSGETLRPRTRLAGRLLQLFPGVLIFPVLFSLLVAAIFALPGMPFGRTAWCTAAAVTLAVPAGTLLLKRLLPEPEIRLELLFLGQVLLTLLGIIATVNGRTHVAGVDAVAWPALAGVAALLFAGGAAGWMIYAVKTKRIHQK